MNSGFDPKLPEGPLDQPVHDVMTPLRRDMKIAAHMISCQERQPVREQTLQNLRATDWSEPVYLEIDEALYDRRQDRQEHTAFRLLEKASHGDADFILFLEDDLLFNRHLKHNVKEWAPLRSLPPNGYFFASLYNPNVREREKHSKDAFFIADPKAVYGSQAFLLSVRTARHIYRHWSEVRGMQDMKMSRLAAQVSSIYYHSPSLVQHSSVPSVWGGRSHHAVDFNAAWKAEAGSTTSPLRCVTLDQTRHVDGWLDDAEAELLMAVSDVAVRRFFDRLAIVDVGSYCGKSTILLGLTARQLGVTFPCVYSVDRHDGRVTGTNQAVMQLDPTFDKFWRNIQEAGLSDLVVPFVGETREMAWHAPIALLFIDGLHDYQSVSADFDHFSEFVPPGGLVAFHDCADCFPDVKRFVSELIRGGDFVLFKQVRSLAVLEKRLPYAVQ